jgi:hypothetical protein
MEVEAIACTPWIELEAAARIEVKSEGEGVGRALVSTSKTEARLVKISAVRGYAGAWVISSRGSSRLHFSWSSPLCVVWNCWKSPVLFIVRADWFMIAGAYDCWGFVLRRWFW